MSISTVKTSLTTQEKTIDCLVHHALIGGHQIAVWKSPKNNEIQLILDKTDKIKRVELELDTLPEGFIAHPFGDQEDQKAFFLEASDYFKINIDLPEIPDVTEKFKSVQLDQTQTKKQIRNHLKQLYTQTPGESCNPTTKEDFIEIVHKGIQSISEGEIAKVVPARMKKLQLKEGFDLTKTFLELCKNYPNAFVNFFHIPSVGTWLGATPEVLIKTEGQYFYTMALAGTQKASGDNPIKNAAWTQKEIEEQALVSRYIVNNFKKIRLREYEENGPKTVLAGNLLHLRSDFRVDMEATNFPQLGSVMLKLLHPTSAVCGSPKEKAMDFIIENEKFDRSFFSGFIGPVNIENQTAIYVNLRTTQFINNEVILYAGAGVTEDSIPEKEWEETSMKCDIIGKFIQ
ncbi:chorismate-binding protein [Echinicola sp. 20G]|uniref:chorismate-binding protein n=1 Tax=Echinicola sp. 20G TaxID=2781961 RepID=UPI001910BC6A|nr:chorismate-binding protein [Echinicola sp. 20G]